MAALDWADADERAAAEHSGDDGADADPAPAGAGAGWNFGAAPGDERASVCAVFHFEIWMDAGAGAGGDLRVGAESSAADWRGLPDGELVADTKETAARRDSVSVVGMVGP